MCACMDTGIYIYMYMYNPYKYFVIYIYIYIYMCKIHFVFHCRRKFRSQTSDNMQRWEESARRSQEVRR